MTETWFPFTRKMPGPSQKVGYGATRTRTLTDIEGEIKHSMEGTFLHAG